MILAHIMGIPFEESITQLAPAGAAIVTAIAIAGRAGLGRLRPTAAAFIRPESHRGSRRRRGSPR